MNWRIPKRFVEILGVSIIGSTIVLYSGAVWAQGTEIEPPDVGVSWANQDYFDPSQRVLLGTVEQYHLNAELWRQIALGDWPNAFYHIRYTLQVFPNHPRGLSLVGEYAKATKNRTVAITYFNKAVRLFPGHAITHAQHGNYLVEIGQIDDGIVKLRNAIELEPKLAVAHAWLAQAYYKKGNRELALKEAQLAKELGYRNPIAEQQGTK
jgi:tetratricopeptide (TPR) repeat protein